MWAHPFVQRIQNLSFLAGRFSYRLLKDCQQELGVIQGKRLLGSCCEISVLVKIVRIIFLLWIADAPKANIIIGFIWIKSVPGRDSQDVGVIIPGTTLDDTCGAACRSGWFALILHIIEIVGFIPISHPFTNITTHVHGSILTDTIWESCNWCGVNKTIIIGVILPAHRAILIA